MVSRELMADIRDTPQLAQPPQTASPRPIRTIHLVQIGSACTAVGVAVLSKDCCFSTVGCTIVAAVAIGLVDAFVIRRLISSRRWARRSQTVLVLLVCGLPLAYFAGTTNRLFNRVFGISPPQGVGQLVIDSASIGLSGAQTILMRFTADQTTIDRLVRDQGFTVDKDMNLFYETGKDWARLWSHAFSNFPESGGRAWEKAALMADPVLLVHNHSEGITSVTVKMLWDRASGRAYVVCVY
jgi:hypothetical protein